MRSVLLVIRRLLRHPLGARHPVRTVARFVAWQASSRLGQRVKVVPFVDGARLMMSRGMHGATGNHYVGLLEFEPMSFILHVLGREDLFVDVGANVGAYTILGSAVAGASTVAIEPVAASVAALQANVELNDVARAVTVIAAAAGADCGEIRVTVGSGSTNRVVPDAGSGVATVPLMTLDSLDLAPPGCPRGCVVLKIDVEGFEAQVLRGAERLLLSGAVLAVITELNGSGAKYGDSNEDVQALLSAAGYIEVTYEPFSRSLTADGDPSSETRIFVKDIPECRRRVASAPSRRLGTGDIV